jgi:hypothetical protein
MIHINIKLLTQKLKVSECQYVEQEYREDWDKNTHEILVLSDEVNILCQVVVWSDEKGQDKEGYKDEGSN